MEYLTPLENSIQSTNFLVRDVAKFGLNALNRFQSCRNNDVIHRDIEDDNIFVFDRGKYKVGDFDVSKVLKDGSRAESLRGTPNFLTSEVYLGREGYTKSVDLYSLDIVLYRLLNCNRNPSLPHFPEQYLAQDEDAAFEERMSGKTPDLPAPGGEEVGRVIVKTISSGSGRFQTADEFMSILKLVIDNTPSEVLNEKINSDISSCTKPISEPNAKEYGSALGETAPLSGSEEHIEDERNNSINKHLFESIDEVPLADTSEVKPVVRPKQKHERENVADTAPPKSNRRVVNSVPPTINEPDEPIALDEKVMNKFVFVVLATILLVEAIAYFIMIPNIYGRIVSFADQLLTGLQNIIDTIRDPNAVLPQANSITGIRIFWWVQLTGLITSLFFVGK